MNALVVPTIRANCIARFLDEWKYEQFDDIIIIEDNPEKTFKIGKTHHYSWQEIHDEWGEDSWVFSKRDSAIRAFGFWKAWQMGAEVIFTLDDDCYPLKDEWHVIMHTHNLEETPKWCHLVPDVTTRGLPYFNWGTLQVVANVGLWTNVADLDAIHQLTSPILDFNPGVKDNRVIPHGQYFPFTGMNFCFKREVAPMTYFPLMGEGQPYRRFDDIWFGIIFKKVCDHLGYHITVGHPFVDHHKASDPMVNLVKEAPGIPANETFWEKVDEIELTCKNPKDCMFEIGEGLYKNDDAYIKRLGQAITVWAGHF